MNTATGTDDTHAKPKPSFGKLAVRRTLIAIVLMLLIVIPSVIMLAISHQPAAMWASMGTIVGIVTVVYGGLRVGLVTALVLALLAPVGIVAGVTPITGAALMALMAIAVGGLSRIGMNRIVMLVPIFVAWPMMAPTPWLPTATIEKLQAYISAHGLTLDRVSQVPAGGSASAASAKLLSHMGPSSLVAERMDSTYLAWTAAYFFVGAVIPIVVLAVALRKFTPPKLKSHPRSESMPYTIAITILLTVATYYFLDHPKQTAGAFMIATILVLCQVGDGNALRPTVQRVLGTLGGGLIVWVIASQLDSVKIIDAFGAPLPVQMFILGVVFGVAALISKFSPRAWIYYIFITPTAVCFNAFTVKMAGNVGEQRVIDNLVGAALVLVATGLTLGFAHWGSRLQRSAPAGTPAPPA